MLFQQKLYCFSLLFYLLERFIILKYKCKTLSAAYKTLTAGFKRYDNV